MGLLRQDAGDLARMASGASSKPSKPIVWWYRIAFP